MNSMRTNVITAQLHHRLLTSQKVLKTQRSSPATARITSPIYIQNSMNAFKSSIGAPQRLPAPNRRSRLTHATKAIAAAQAAPAAVGIAAVAVGWLVIAGSVVRSLPQILRIVKNKSAQGLSLTSIFTETVVYSVTVAYNTRFNYPFSTWGDTLMCLIQQAAIVALVFHYNDTIKTRTKLLATVSYAAFSAFIFSQSCGIGMLTSFQACSAAMLGLGGRLPQIILNIRRGNSGELSAMSTGLSFLGNLARVFTTVALVGDKIILATAASQLVLNGILTWQCLDTARREKAAVVAAAMG